MNIFFRIKFISSFSLQNNSFQRFLQMREYTTLSERQASTPSMISLMAASTSFFFETSCWMSFYSLCNLLERLSELQGLVVQLLFYCQFFRYNILCYNPFKSFFRDSCLDSSLLRFWDMNSVSFWSDWTLSSMVRQCWRKALISVEIYQRTRCSCLKDQCLVRLVLFINQKTLIAKVQADSMFNYRITLNSYSPNPFTSRHCVSHKTIFKASPAKSPLTNELIKQSSSGKPCQKRRLQKGGSASNQQEQEEGRVKQRKTRSLREQYQQKIKIYIQKHLKPEAVFTVDRAVNADLPRPTQGVFVPVSALSLSCSDEASQTQAVAESPKEKCESGTQTACSLQQSFCFQLTIQSSRTKFARRQTKIMKTSLQQEGQIAKEETKKIKNKLDQTQSSLQSLFLSHSQLLKDSQSHKKQNCQLRSQLNSIQEQLQKSQSQLRLLKEMNNLIDIQNGFLKEQCQKQRSTISRLKQEVNLQKQSLSLNVSQLQLQYQSTHSRLNQYIKQNKQFDSFFRQSFKEKLQEIADIQKKLLEVQPLFVTNKKNQIIQIKLLIERLHFENYLERQRVDCYKYLLAHVIPLKAVAIHLDLSY